MNLFYIYFLIIKLILYLQCICIRHLDPVVYGDYPKIMKKHAGSRLPSFTAEQSKMLRNSYDFIGINYYTARFVAHRPHIDPALRRFRTDHQFERKGKNAN